MLKIDLLHPKTRRRGWVAPQKKSPKWQWKLPRAIKSEKTWWIVAIALTLGGLGSWLFSLRDRSPAIPAQETGQAQVAKQAPAPQKTQKQKARASGGTTAPPPAPTKAPAPVPPRAELKAGETKPCAVTPNCFIAVTPITLTLDYGFHVKANSPVSIKYYGENKTVTVPAGDGCYQMPQPLYSGPKVFTDPKNPNGRITFTVTLGSGLCAK
jgi:hypothetical protein